MNQQSFTMLLILASAAMVYSQCDSNDFVIVKNGTEYLRLNGTNNLWACNNTNLCDIISKLTQTVALRASGDSIAATADSNIIVFPVVDFDTHGGYNVSTGRYTVPVSGYYQVSAFINASNSGTLYAIYVNGQKILYISDSQSNGVATGSGIVKVSAGDVIDLRPNSGNTGTFGGGSNLNISKL